jgi:hypothetical protein
LLLALPSVAERFCKKYRLPLGYNSMQTGESMHTLVSGGKSNHQFTGKHKMKQLLETHAITTDIGEKLFPQPACEHASLPNESFARAVLKVDKLKSKSTRQCLLCHREQSFTTDGEQALPDDHPLWAVPFKPKLFVETLATGAIMRSSTEYVWDKDVFYFCSTCCRCEDVFLSIHNCNLTSEVRVLMTSPSLTLRVPGETCGTTRMCSSSTASGPDSYFIADFRKSYQHRTFESKLWLNGRIKIE